MDAGDKLGASLCQQPGPSRSVSVASKRLFKSLPCSVIPSQGSYRAKGGGVEPATPRMPPGHPTWSRAFAKTRKEDLGLRGKRVL